MEKNDREYLAHFLQILLPFMDLVILIACFGFSLWFRFSSGYHIETNPFGWYRLQFYTLIFMAVIWLGIFQAQRLYHTRVIITKVRQALQVLKGVTIGTLLYIFLSYLLKTDYMEQSRLVIGYSWGSSFVILSLFRCFPFRSLYLYIVKEGIIRRVLIAGAGGKGSTLIKNLRS